MQRAFSPPPLARSRGDESPPLARSCGDESPPLARLRGDESPPLVRSRGDEIPPLARSSRGQLSSLRLFRQGSSVQLKVFQRLLGLKVADSAVLHLGLLHMCPLQLWLEYRVPWTAWTSGFLRIAATSKLWRNPDHFGRGVPLCSVAVRVMITTDASTHGWGVVCKGMPASGL